MKWAYQIKYKVRAAAALATIILIILAGNLLIREKFSSIDRSMTSMMDDRLKASAYIYSISNHLYQKRLMMESGQPAANEIRKHDHSVSVLIQDYEKTYLTKEERRHWQSFKAHLYDYAQFAATSGETKQSQSFERLMSELNALSSIQLAEGQGLQKNTHSIVSSTLLISTLEISLLIVLGLFTLVLLSTSDFSVFKHYDNDVRLN